MYDLFFLEREVQTRMQEAQRDAENRRLLRSVKMDQRRWLPRQGCWLLCQLGRLLVALGQHLQRYGHPQTFTLNGQAGNGTLPRNGDIVI